MSIELRLTDVDPPDPDPLRTIYRDITNLPDPMLLGITIRYFNHDDVGLYFQITGEADGYTFGTVNMGLLGSGLNAYRNLDNFASRARPAAETQEAVKLILKAYTDAGYSNLKWTYERMVLVVIINSVDGSWTLDEYDDFDDGTLMGWAVTCEQNCAGGFPTLTSVVDFVLSGPFSIRMENRSLTTNSGSYMHKNFTTANRNIVYAIINIRVTGPENYIKHIKVQRNGTILVFLGRPWDAVLADYVPTAKWMRIVVPLPKNTALQVRILFRHRHTGVPPYRAFMWQDNFKIISKD